MDMPANIQVENCGIELVSDACSELHLSEESCLAGVGVKREGSADRYQMLPVGSSRACPLGRSRGLCRLAAGYLPMIVQNPSGKSDDDVYIRIQGTNPLTQSLCYLTFNPDGTTSYFDISNQTPGDADGSDYCVPLSALPLVNGNRMLQMLPLESGRLFVSVGKKIVWHEPSLTNSSDPDCQTIYSMIEFTSRNNPNPTPGNPNGIWFDFSAVDDVSLPLQLTTHTSDGQPDQVRGYSGSASAFMNKAVQLLQQYDTTSGHIWSGLVQKDGSGEVLRILAAKQALAPLGSFPNNYFEDYLQNTFLPYFETNTLSMDGTALDGSIETYVGQVVSVGGQSFFQFKGEADGNVVMVPAYPDRAKAWFSGGLAADEFIPISPQGATEAYKDLVRDLSAFVNAGVLPSVAQGQNITKDWMESHRSDFYQAPVYNVYDRALHEAGLDAYAYDYDDRLGQDGTETGPFAGSVVTVTLPTLSSE